MCEQIMKTYMAVICSFILLTVVSPALANNRANQMNPNNPAYWKSRGWSGRPTDWKARTYGTYDNNRANQLNPNNSAYWKSRGYTQPPQATKTYRVPVRGIPASGETVSQKENNVSNHSNHPAQSSTNTNSTTATGFSHQKRAASNIKLTPSGLYSIVIPVGSTYVENNRSGFSQLIVTNDYAKAAIAITAGTGLPSDSTITVKDEVDQAMKHINKNDNKGELISFLVDVAEVNGIEAINSEVVQKQDDVKYYKKCVTIAKNGAFVNFLIAGDEESYESLLPVFDYLLDSFKLVE